MNDAISLEPALRLKIKGNEILIRTVLDIGLTADPVELYFDRAVTGAVLEKTVTLHNPGNIPLSVTRCEVSNNCYSIPEDVLPFTLKPGKQKTVAVRFLSVDHALQEGTLTFFSHDLEHPAISLRGAAVQDAVRLSPPSVDFGKVITGTDVTFPIRIWNRTDAPLTITQWQVSNPRFSVAAAAEPVVINPGKSGKIIIRFSAIDESSQEGMLTLTVSDSAIAGLLIPLFGAGRNLFPDNGTGTMQAWEGRSCAREFTGKLIQDTLALYATYVLPLLKQFSTCVQKKNPFSAASPNAQQLMSFLGGGINALVRSLTPAPDANSSSEHLFHPPFNFSDYQGEYVWQPSSSQFKYSGGGEGIRIVFPGPDSMENNAEFRITEYEEQSFAENMPPFRTFYQPTRFSASLYENKKEVALLDLSFQHNGDGSASRAFGELFVPPYSLSFSYDNTKPGATQANALLHGETKLIAVLASCINYEDGLKLLSKLKSLEGNFKIREVEGNGVLDYKLAEIPESDPNKFFKLVILGGADKKIGDIVVSKEWSDSSQMIEEIPCLMYGDGSKEKAEIILQAWLKVLRCL